MVWAGDAFPRAWMVVETTEGSFEHYCGRVMKATARTASVVFGDTVLGRHPYHAQLRNGIVGLHPDDMQWWMRDVRFLTESEHDVLGGARALFEWLAALAR